MKLQFTAGVTTALLAALAPLAAQARGFFDSGSHDALLARRHSLEGHFRGKSAFSKRGAVAGSPSTPRPALHRRDAKTFKDQPDNIADGTATADEGCTLWVQPADGDSCYSTIALSDGLTLEDFFDLNPSLKKDCQMLLTSAAYCIDTDDEHTEEATCSSKSSSKTKTKSTGKKEASETKKASKAVQQQAQSSQSAAPAASSQASNDNNNNNSSSNSLITGTHGLLQLYDSTCGSADATADTTSTSGPNGAISFLNCGLDSGGWTAPNLHISQVKYKGLDEAGDVFSDCSSYFDLFNKHGEKYGIPPIFLASITMQESSCDPSVTGGGGEAGLMQITSDKCGDAPNGDCYDPDYNIATGSAYFKNRLDSFDGNVLLALGGYNGWSAGMTYSSATAAANTGCCKCQNNLDYLHGILNCLAQGFSNDKCKHYNNLAVCD